MTVIQLFEKDINEFPSIHHWIQAKLDLPDYYGHNLDALWDCLSGEITLPSEIQWICANESLFVDEQKLQIAAFISLFEEADEQIEGLSFSYLSAN